MEQTTQNLYHLYWDADNVSLINIPKVRDFFAARDSDAESMSRIWMLPIEKTGGIVIRKRVRANMHQTRSQRY